MRPALRGLGTSTVIKSFQRMRPYIAWLDPKPSSSNQRTIAPKPRNASLRPTGRCQCFNGTCESQLSQEEVSRRKTICSDCLDVYRSAEHIQDTPRQCGGSCECGGCTTKRSNTHELQKPSTVLVALPSSSNNHEYYTAFTSFIIINHQWF